jgi:thioredoxin-related protein
MKTLAIYFFMMFVPKAEWQGDFEAAKVQAVKEHKLILINFSGSDWCGPCIRLRSEILESAKFENYASDHLVLVRADFPRQKKNMPAREQVKRNEVLADKYNADGKFPYTLLVDDKGKVLKAWDGFPNESPDQFVSDISSIADSQ